MTSFGAVATCVRVGEIRYEDVAQQVGGADLVTVRVLDHAGIERQVQLHFIEKWGGGGSWQRQLQCPRCSRPARVLAVHGGQAACGRCSPRRTAHHRHKNSRAWREEGSLADELARTVLRGNSSAGRSSMKRLADRLREGSTARSALVHEQAMRLIRTIDLAGLIQQ